MPLTGEYEPSTFDFSRDRVDLYERSGGTEGTAHPGGERVIVLTSVGAKTGKLRKTPLMRVESDGEYAVVASLGRVLSAWMNGWGVLLLIVVALGMVAPLFLAWRKSPSMSAGAIMVLIAGLLLRVVIVFSSEGV